MILWLVLKDIIINSSNRLKTKLSNAYNAKINLEKSIRNEVLKSIENERKNQYNKEKQSIDEFNKRINELNKSPPKDHKEKALKRAKVIH